MLEMLFRQEWPYLLVFNAALLVWLFRARPAERRNVWLTTIFLGLGSLGFALGELAAHLGIKGGAMLAGLFTMLLGMIMIRLWGLIFFRLILPSFNIVLPRILEDVVVMVAYVIWGLVRLRYAGVDLTQLVATSAILTAVVAFSMQDTLGNILSGIAIQLDESLELGQWVKVGDASGRVLQIGWRSTLIQTRNGETVVVPNAWLMKNSFQVIGRPFDDRLQWRRWVWFSVDWSHPPSQVIHCVEQAIHSARISNVASEPLPNAVLMEARDGMARYALRYWLTDFALDDPTDSQVRAHLLTALARADIALASDTHNVVVTKDNDKTAQIKQAQDLNRRLEALAEVELFSGFTDEEKRQLALQLRFAPFERGDVISRQGAVAHWLYILTQGEVDIWRDYDSAQPTLLGHLSAGDFFGEMGLMTGAPRSATVVASSYVECYRLDRAGFEAIMTARPELADLISRVLERRLAQNAHSAPQVIQAAPLPQYAELRERVRRFFGLSANGNGK
ncbi:cyclic nucleotide-binding domain-containing protein [Chitinimonas lacunae]|uniref:Small-conductance mechanosensitive channel n=1 Tax=Chitinimonas lacunae TaxID=1963018 RepID=A0ABV8MSS7_9NEIS